MEDRRYAGQVGWGEDFRIILLRSVYLEITTIFVYP